MKSLAQLPKYARTPILDDGSDVIQWWNHVSPADRLQVVRNVITTTALDDLGSEPAYIQQRILVPEPADEEGLEKLEKFRSLKPEQRLLLLKQFHQE
ncbi:MAG: hypothetical protein GY797_09585 [Deltaproteobacteria bacterium]|nr:hypothetical protein [Deltaproteobacteria bacterium]